MPLEASTVAGRARTMWCLRLSSALRTALACAIVGCATLYGPKFIVSEIKFAAFSYLTAVLIVSDATLGEALRGGWHALCATVQVVPLAVLGRWVLGPTGSLPIGAAAVAVAVASFAVAMPECTHVTAKRIAFGQIVLVCSDAVLVGGGVMHPVYVAASTGLGALASIVALLVPYPGLACNKVRKLCRVYAENAYQRMNMYLKAFSAKDSQTKMELISQAKPLAETGAKLLRSIRILEEGMQWERPWSRYLNPDSVSPVDTLQRMELHMRGMEYSLASSPAFPLRAIDQERLSNALQGVSAQLEQKIEQLCCHPPLHSTTQSGKSTEFTEKPSLSPTLENGWVFFYFSCLDALLNHALDTRVAPRELQTQRTFKSWIQRLTSKARLEFAFKCSLSLGLAVLFGLIFDRENGCWAGLTIAISIVTGKQAIFTVANTRAQGTAIGSVYGIICCFLFHYEEMRLLALLPWIIFTGLLRCSKMYGQTGGVSAAIGALLILGRKHYGDPNEFAIARLTEVFIGLSAFIMTEVLLQPVRAATIAKNHLCRTLSSLQDCIKETANCRVEKNQIALTDAQGNFNSLVCELNKFVADAEMEPDFWYMPFRAACYRKVVGSMNNIADLLYFITYNFETLSQLSETSRTECKELQEQMKGELELLQKSLSTSQVYLETTSLIESRADSQDTTDEKLSNLEAGELPNTFELNVMTTYHEEAERNTDEESECTKRLREKVIQCLCASGFCISSLKKEIDDTKICITEIEEWEKNSKK